MLRQHQKKSKPLNHQKKKSTAQPKKHHQSTSLFKKQPHSIRKHHLHIPPVEPIPPPSEQQGQAKHPKKVITLADFTPPAGCDEAQRNKSLFRPSMYYVQKGVFTHPGFDESQIKNVDVVHFQPENAGDKAALFAVNVLRHGFDFFSGYRHPPAGEENNRKYSMTRKQILTRCIMLESVAAVPGLVGSMCRHLGSIRLLRRDLGWMETLIEESHNERMHLLSFLEYYKPGWMFKLAILGAQGVMMNSFFLAYLVAPRVCHRFVGFLEEEACVTYSRVISEIENGWHDDWALGPAPDLALAYWKMRPDATFKDMVYYIRMDEATHRSVNHTFANLDNAKDPNPFALYYSPESPLVKPSVFDVESQLKKPLGWKREDIDVSASLHPQHPQFSTYNGGEEGAFHQGPASKEQKM